MNDEAESSRAGLRYGNDTISDTELEPTVIDKEEDAARREETARERRVDAKRKRVVFLDHLLRELDILVFLELVTVYHLDCSFFWFTCKALIHLTLLTPLPDLQLTRQHDEQKPFLPLILFCFVVNFLLHLLYPAPLAGENTRGYLHGGLMIDFIGQQGPTSKWKLASLDTCILVLQLVMVSVHVKRRELKKNLAKITSSTSTSRESTGAQASASTGENAGAGAATNSDRNQDADSEERCVLRRTDTLSDIGADADEEDALLPSSSETGTAIDALDALASGQVLIGDFHPINTLLQEHENYRQTRSESGASSSLSPSTLRQLHTIRVRFGVGGG
ncbi:DUF1746-domain-containing protein [Zopfia rhizophila CBS 207.26]|uniref:DUF1746-domain-containing protein n=1 Tax=Zopfia rhizophila CBS 207.26 TaxID=1314779 RepID=A0A6A6EJ24_9PEZI|nr:DUF1746-domain-containing protein [Zopfia rhizophila CBS 207.26]